MIFVIIAILVLAALYIFAIFPSVGAKGDIFDKHKLFAHRGLFGGKVPENSMEAFRNAVEAGYGIEFDVHVTTDGICVVHHDNSLMRICGVNKKIEECEYGDIRDVTLPNGEKLPKFSDVLDLIDGRVPLIIELKCDKSDVHVANAAAEILEGYSGEYCIESFDPFVVARFKKFERGVLCGQLAGRTYEKTDKFSRKIVKFLAENMIFNFISRPDFAAYQFEHRNNLSFVLCRAFGAKTAFWTITDSSELDECRRLSSVAIFQDFLA
ncbi:MAG: glycerophosphodiester phosphodiesterase [Clostridiales bacterium]|nr:glycerophosphodiester phosphodiesterase [Clostridiales bacterium]